PEQSLIPPSKEVNADDTVDKSLFRASVQPVTQSKAPTNLKTTKKRIPPSSKPKSPNKVKVILPKKKVTETQHIEVTVATADATKSQVASELEEGQGNHPSATKAEKDTRFIAMEEVAEDQYLEILVVEQLLDEADKLIKAVQDTLESPYNTESEIKVVKSFLTSNFSKLQDVSDSDLQSMLDDDLGSVSGFEDADSNDTHENESFIVHQIFVEIKSSLPALVTTTLKEQMRGLLLDALKDTLPQLIKDSIKSLKRDERSSRQALSLYIYCGFQLLTCSRSQEKSNPETPKDTDVQGEQSVAKENIETAMVTHKLEEKKSEGVPSGE
nr:hypothetical protein [Tanacetum cinerariifolium]